jgi:hypothetical protein
VISTTDRHFLPDLTKGSSKYPGEADTAIFEIGFHVLHRETISRPTAKTIVKLPADHACFGPSWRMVQDMKRNTAL